MTRTTPRYGVSFRNMSLSQKKECPRFPTRLGQVTQFPAPALTYFRARPPGTPYRRGRATPGPTRYALFDGLEALCTSQISEGCGVFPQCQRAPAGPLNPIRQNINYDCGNSPHARVISYETECYYCQPANRT